MRPSPGPQNATDVALPIGPRSSHVKHYRSAAVPTGRGMRPPRLSQRTNVNEAFLSPFLHPPRKHLPGFSLSARRRPQGARASTTLPCRGWLQAPFPPRCNWKLRFPLYRLVPFVSVTWFGYASSSLLLLRFFSWKLRVAIVYLLRFVFSFLSYLLSQRGSCAYLPGRTVGSFSGVVAPRRCLERGCMTGRHGAPSLFFPASSCRHI